MKSKLLWAILLTCFNPKANARQWSKAREVLNKRCVVCHGCYDAPCQLKMESYMGLRRGAHKLRVYDGDTVQDANSTSLISMQSLSKNGNSSDFILFLGVPKTLKILCF